ncbi:hypothetical protein VTN00DRAFT_7700 [Thermoascus crustaceus]|uniref:uncharacterized protein n=1 Tax=Thermoascus crustaceus TaxID=5088 RepID=UPI00374327EF
MENARRIWLERLEARWELPPRWGLGTNPLGAHSRLEKASMQAAGEKSGRLPLDRSPPGGSETPRPPICLATNSFEIRDRAEHPLDQGA